MFEQKLRRRLAIPPDAEKVLILGETSHWDPNWLYTSEKYYEKRIRRILDEVLEELEREPRRIYSVECLFFLKLYWERNPEKQEILRELVNRGRIRLTGTGITTPDTLLPETEAILRDYLHGQEWMRAQGMTPEPRLAYLPDDFGHSPALPSILRALGFEHAGITRIDGMHFLGADYRPRRAFPRPGSSAERLLRDLRTLDFVWRGTDGSEVLCHWNAFTYFQGDMLAHLGIIRWMGIVFGMPWRTRRHIARRVKGFARSLLPLSRTPYLFCPIGCDFNGPIRGLLDLLDRYNRTQYPDTGVWAVNAGMDDYLDLVDCHRGRLPTLELDPNPYWMGFYASRPGMKQRCRRATHKLLVAERLTATAIPAAPEIHRQLRQAWDLLVVSNHHDFITGTSPDSTVRDEQEPWMKQAEALADEALARLTAEGTTETASVSARSPPAPPSWRLADGQLEIDTGQIRLLLSEDAGGCIVSCRRDGDELLAGPANDLVAYRDSGGLWRMGHEYLGGSFREIARASRFPAKIRVSQDEGALAVRVESTFAGRPFLRHLWLCGESPIVRMRLEGAAARRLTITCRFPTVLNASELTMDVPGGLATRPAQRGFDPTFWPAGSFVHVRDGERLGGLAAFLGGPACVSLREPGALEWVALRNAHRERAFGFLPVLCHPVTGFEPQRHRFDYAVWFTPGGDAQANQLPMWARSLLLPLWLEPGRADLWAHANTFVTTDRRDLLVSAVKPASRGPGLVARVENPFHLGGEARLQCRRGPIRAATLCDARERDLRELEVRNGAAVLPVGTAIASVRLVF